VKENDRNNLLSTLDLLYRVILGLLGNHNEVLGMTYTKLTSFEVTVQYRPDQYTVKDIENAFIDKALAENFDITIEAIETWEIKQ